MERRGVLYMRWRECGERRQRREERGAKRETEETEARGERGEEERGDRGEALSLRGGNREARLSISPPAVVRLDWGMESSLASIPPCVAGSGRTSQRRQRRGSRFSPQQSFVWIGEWN
jgi:hypothetical protein